MAKIKANKVKNGSMKLHSSEVVYSAVRKNKQLFIKRVSLRSKGIEYVQGKINRDCLHGLNIDLIGPVGIKRRCITTKEWGSKLRRNKKIIPKFSVCFFGVFK